ncbi:hypothetical protein GWI33_016439 [Rhynchophorus ferrugineus]|uniref:Uncharacterized protein n=1 Tax=Rhynchophorus ferrugineus TaxID=354439 RepID=A0A834M508_RHYFE|nr:hypothetical protein GWI33_016439 [Rhynchophorus ferrugineus]
MARKHFVRSPVSGVSVSPTETVSLNLREHCTTTRRFLNERLAIRYTKRFDEGFRADTALESDATMHRDASLERNDGRHWPKTTNYRASSRHRTRSRDHDRPSPNSLPRHGGSDVIARGSGGGEK